MTDAQPPSKSWYRFLVFGLLAAAYFLVYFHRLSPAVVAVDMMADLSAGGALMGFLAAAYFYPYALMQLPAGLLSDSWGPRRTVTASFFLAGLASILFGLADSIILAIVARVLVGLGVSMLFVPTMKILTQWFKKSEFAMMAALLMTVGGLGSLGAAAPLALMSNWIGWRGSFVGIGAITLVIALAIWFFVRNRPEDLGMKPPENRPPAPVGADAISLGRGLKMVLTAPAFWPLAVWFFCTAGVFFTFGGLWGGPYLVHVHGLTKTEASGVLSMLAAAMIVGSPLLGWLSDRVVKSRKKLLVAAALTLTALTAVLAFAPTAPGVPALYGLCFLLSLSASAIVVIGFTTAKELFPVHIAGTSVGAINFFPFLGGAVLQPLVGAVLEAAGPAGGPYSAAAYGRAFTVLFAAAVVAAAASFLIRDTFDRAA
jgi:sugar phosphate permease